MTPDEIEKDRAEGTPGPWMALGTPVIGFTEVKAQPLAVRGFTRRICCVDAVNNTDRERDANARRIARLPELEQAYLDLTAEVRRLTRERDAALAGAMRVRKLVWTGGWHGRRSGVYTILPNYGKGPKRFMLSHGSNIIGWFDGEEEAQAVAQADHEARTRAAIEPDAPSVSAAAKVLLDALDMPPYPIGQQALAQTRRVITALATKENSDE